MATKSTETKIEEKSKKGLTNKHVVLILGSLAIICAAVVAVFVLTRQPEAVGDTKPIGSLVIDRDNVADINARIEEKVARGMFETYMNMTWSFPDGESASTDAVMGNSINNRFPFWFEVTVDDEVVYTSSLLPVGSQVKEIVLSKDLDKGSYSAVLNVHMVDENNEPVDSNAGFGITLVIKN